MIRRLFLALALLASGPAAAQSDLGVVLMYGKQATWSTATGLRDMAATLEKAGAKVALPEMPWRKGSWESINVTVGQAHALIDQEVAKLKARGAQRIVVGGHSLGANVALSYAVVRGNLAGVMMAAPGHSPDNWVRFDAGIRAAVMKVKALYDAGQRTQSFQGPDINTNERNVISTTVEVYGSWMNPMGRASMETQAPLLPATTPIFVAVSKDESGYSLVKDRIFKPAAKNPYSLYVETVGAHGMVDFAVSKRATDWILGLPR